MFETKKLKMRLVMIICLIIAYFIATMLHSTLFIGSSPKIDKYFADKIKRSVWMAFTKAGREEKQKINSVEQLATSGMFNQIAPGVKAAQNENGTYVIISMGDVQYQEYTFTVHGKPLKIRVPVGQEPPPMQTLEQLEN